MNAVWDTTASPVATVVAVSVAVVVRVVVRVVVVVVRVVVPGIVVVVVDIHVMCTTSISTVLFVLQRNDLRLQSSNGLVLFHSCFKQFYHVVVC